MVPLRSPGTLAWALCLFVLSQPAKGQDFLKTYNSSAFADNLKTVLNDTLECGSEVSPKRLADVTSGLLPMWRALPKNADGRIPWRTVRYLAHRYFLRKSSLMIRGSEPSLQLKHPSDGVPSILDGNTPPHLKALLSSRFASTHGFGLDDVAHLVLVLEKLVFESQTSLLAKIYRLQNTSQIGTISEEKLSSLLEEYMVHWMMSGDTKGIQVLTERPELRAATFPGWNDTSQFAAGQIKALRYARARAAGKETSLVAKDFSFQDAHEVVGSITSSFTSYWEPHCTSMKRSLFEMDPHRTGRVPLSSFYGAALESEWHFTESEAYLRQLGALDETSGWGSQVIIPNYIQAAPNCIITTQHYWLCCQNECESIFSEIESAVGAPTASPELILQVVGNMTAQETLDDDTHPDLGGRLTEQLHSVAKAHEGDVPLHGRLFAQWLHYAFPHQCPFPHKVGSTTSVAPLEYGSRSAATREEMLRHTATGPTLQASMAALLANNSSEDTFRTREELQWMSQWSSEEELLTDPLLDLRPPWSDSTYIAAGGVALLLAGMLAAMRVSTHDKLNANDIPDSWLLKLHVV